MFLHWGLFNVPYIAQINPAWGSPRTIFTPHKTKQIMYLAINKHNYLEVHSFEWTQNDELIIFGKSVNVNDWEIIWVEQMLPC